MTHTLERHFKIWDDVSGDCILVGDDHDGLDLLELRRGENYLTVTREDAELLIRAISAWLKDDNELHSDT